MKRRVEKKVERSMMAGKICELQRRCDEYERFLGDIYLMITRRDPDRFVIEHELEGSLADFVWDLLRALLKKHKELKDQLAQFSQES